MMCRLRVLVMLVMVSLVTAGCEMPEGAGVDRQSGTAAEVARTQPTESVMSPAPEATTTPVVDLTDCGSTIFAAPPPFELRHLTWLSHQVVVGTVVARHPSVWGSQAPNPAEPLRHLVFTYSTVRVDQQLRGLPADTVMVRQLGGTIGECTQTVDNEPALQVGQRMLLFLRECEKCALEMPVAPVAYFAVGGRVGLWIINDDNTVAAPAGHLQGYDGLSLTEIALEIATLLAAPPPPSPVRDEIVPLHEAPASTPVP